MDNYSNIILAVHILIALALIAVVLLQRSEGGALGIGGGGGGLMSARGAGNALTRTTTILAAAFFVTSVMLTIIARQTGPRALDIEGAAPAPVSPASETLDLPSLPGLPGLESDAAQPAAPEAGLEGGNLEPTVDGAQRGSSDATPEEGLSLDRAADDPLPPPSPEGP